MSNSHDARDAGVSLAVFNAVQGIRTDPNTPCELDLADMGLLARLPDTLSKCQ